MSPDEATQPGKDGQIFSSKQDNKGGMPNQPFHLLPAGASATHQLQQSKPQLPAPLGVGAMTPFSLAPGAGLRKAQLEKQRAQLDTRDQARKMRAMLEHMQQMQCLSAGH